MCGWLQTDPADPDVLIRLFSEQCSSANMELWLTAAFAYKGPLLVGEGTTAGPALRGGTLGRSGASVLVPALVTAGARPPSA